MLPQAATLDADEEKGGNGAARRQPPSRAGETMKFSYKTGSRPLDGYTIKRGVGIGGFGDVYFAVTDAGKEVALKRVQRNMDVEVRGVSQCLNLKHPNLISLFDLKYDDEGQAWVVMEFVAGDSLKDVVERNLNGMPQEEVEHWFRGIAAGVGSLHDGGIVHRDLKPGNIFDDDGVVKIGDYGLSKFISTSRRSGQTESVGTFHYMAPEIGRGVYGKEIDIYALGIILYEMLTGRVPFDGESSQEIIMKHLTDNPDLTGISQPYRAVIQRALQKDPEKRFRSIPEMLKALDATSSEADIQTSMLESRVTRDEPMYIGDTEDETDMVFGPVQHYEVVNAELVPPVREAPPAGGPVPTQTVAARRPAAPRDEGKRKVRRPQITGAAKALILIAIVLVVYFNPWLWALAVPVGAVYLLYLGTVGIGRLCKGSSSAACGRTAGDEELWLASARKAMKKKPGSERISELTGSMLLSAFIAGILCLVFLILEGNTLNGEVDGWAVYTWLAVTSTIGAWILLFFGKFWEGDDGDHFRRRFVMLVAGLVIGATAFGASQVLAVNLVNQDHWTVSNEIRMQFQDTLFASDGSPMLAAYLIYFAGLFVILRWWTQVDPLRGRRLSIWSTATCLLWAWVMVHFCPFPQPWGFVVAATISVSVQLAAPWVSRKERQAIGQATHEA